MAITYRKGMKHRQGSQNQTAFRFSDEVAEIIINTEGTSFADKFTTICLDYKRNKERRNIEIKELDRNIDIKNKELSNLMNKINEYSSIIQELTTIQKAVIRMAKKDNVIQNL